MNESEYKQWESDAKKCLSCKYSNDEIEKIIVWFSNIRGADEIDLIGGIRLEGFHVFSTPNDIREWSLYNSLMSRLWIYAPLILKQSN